MDLNDAFPSKYLKAGDLKGQPVTLTIKNVLMEEVGQAKDRRLVAYFNGTQKGLVLNKTNANRIAKLLKSTDTDAWRGFKVTLKPDFTEFQGDTIECIRVGMTETSAASAPPPDFDSSGDDDREPLFDQ